MGRAYGLWDQPIPDSVFTRYVTLGKSLDTTRPLFPLIRKGVVIILTVYERHMN